MSAFERQTRMLRRVASKTVVSLREGNEEARAELSALIWAYALLEEIEARGIYDEIRDAAQQRHVWFNQELPPPVRLWTRQRCRKLAASLEYTGHAEAAAAAQRLAEVLPEGWRDDESAEPVQQTP